MKIQKYIAHCGVCSRRAAETLIEEGKVTVDGKLAHIGQIIDESTARVSVGGKRIHLKSCESRYYKFYKPRGVITAMKSQDGRPVCGDYFGGVNGRVFPVGRLDKDSEGLLIVTDDGDLTNRLTHPRHHVRKTYRLTVRGRVEDSIFEKMTRGVVLDDGYKTAPCEIALHSESDEKTVVHISIYEGKNRQIRRMCESCGLEVALLKRVEVGPVSLGRMKPGEIKELTEEETEALLEAVSFEYEVGEATVRPYYTRRTLVTAAPVRKKSEEEIAEEIIRKYEHRKKVAKSGSLRKNFNRKK